MVPIPKYECPQADLSSPSPHGGPTWEMALFYPHQGDWDDADFLLLDHSGIFGLELCDGCLRLLPSMTMQEQSVAGFLLTALTDHLGRHRAHRRGYNIRFRERVPGSRHDFRQPDVLATLDRSSLLEGFAVAADLIAEVVDSDADAKTRDFVEKRLDYAEAGVPEYWVIDPSDETVLQLRLADGRYEEVGTFGIGETVASTAIPDFSVDLAEMFDGVAEG